MQRFGSAVPITHVERDAYIDRYCLVSNILLELDDFRGVTTLLEFVGDCYCQWKYLQLYCGQSERAHG